MGIIAAQPEVVGALVRLFLCEKDIAAGNKAQSVLLELLLADEDAIEGQDLMEKGLFWRRVFRDKDIYGTSCDGI